MDKADIMNRFTYHSPSPEKQEAHQIVREECGNLALMLNDDLPEGREKSLAITHLEEVVFWANASLARN